ncbi:hypothetical protein HN011_003102 [Eciton burchellii]|nr:hypothetical protein HN011_003102 [Eciton burchellii]
MVTGEDANFLENQLSRFNDIVANSIHLERGTRVIKAESSRFEKVLAKIPIIRRRRTMRRKPTTNNTFVGRHYGKIDLDRVGFFNDPSQGPFDFYEGPAKFREGFDKGRQILSGPPSHFFEKKFERIFEGESLTEPWRERAKQRLEDEKKVTVRMVPTSPSKKHSTPGDWYGCFAKSSYFSPQIKVEPRKKVPALPNMKIKPNPLGGPGYVDICLNPYPSYSHEPYDLRKKTISERRFLTCSAPLDFFPPNPYEDDSPGPTYIRPVEIIKKPLGPARLYVPFPKKPGGSHDGCFSKFPEYMSDPYIKKPVKPVTKPKFISSAPSLRTKSSVSPSSRAVVFLFGGSQSPENRLYRDHLTRPIGELPLSATSDRRVRARAPDTTSNCDDFTAQHLARTIFSTCVSFCLFASFRRRCLIYEENFGSCLILGASKKYGHIDHPVQTFGSRRCAIRKFAGLRSKFDDSHVSRKSSLQKLERVFARPHDRPKWVTGQSLSTLGTNKSDDLLRNA